ncbi:MAG: cellulose binding domain-containing protein, partial [Angustibacter sp.]
MLLSYVRQRKSDSIDFVLADFYNDAIKRGYAKPEWYLSVIGSGFEIWDGAMGLNLKSFSVDYTAGTGTKPNPPAPSPKPSASPTPKPDSDAFKPNGGEHCGAKAEATFQWNGGYILRVSVKNNRKTPVNAWRSWLRLGSDHKMTSMWNGADTISFQDWTRVGNPGPITLAPGASASWYALVTRPVNSTATRTTSLCYLKADQ